MILVQVRCILLLLFQWNFGKKGSKKKKPKSSSKKAKRKAAVSSDESGAESDKHVSEPEEGTKHSDQYVIIASSFSLMTTACSQLPIFSV